MPNSRTELLMASLIKLSLLHSEESVRPIGLCSRPLCWMLQSSLTQLQPEGFEAAGDLPSSVTFQKEEGFEDPFLWA